MERLSGLDASFLYLESPNNHMHVAATMTFDPSTVEGGYSFDTVRELLQSRLHLLPNSGNDWPPSRSTSTTRCGSRTPTSTSTTTCGASPPPRRAATTSW